MANLRSDELRAISQALGISRDGTVPILILKIRAKLVEMSLVREPQSAASSAYQTPVASGVVTPTPYIDPTITQAKTITAQKNFPAQRMIITPSPPYAPPLSDSDDDIVITVEPM